jgi:hypothetical protein
MSISVIKPIVNFTGTAKFDTELFPECEVAHVWGINHPILGSTKIRTSKIVNKFDDGSFETLNTIYKPQKYGINEYE